MERHLDVELQKLKTDLLTMAALTENAIHKAISALKSDNHELAELVIEEDKKIDEFEIKLEEQAMQLLALFQPMAKDLRYITTIGMRINGELEQIADLVVNICQRILEMKKDSFGSSMADLSQLADNARVMLKNSIDAFVKKDGELARQVILSDKDSNDLRTKIMKDLMNSYNGKEYIANTLIAPLLVTRDLERICDHTTYIAEDVIYMLKAEMIKHHRERLDDL